MRIILESVSLFELQIDLASFIALLPNLVFSGLGLLLPSISLIP